MRGIVLNYHGEEIRRCAGIISSFRIEKSSETIDLISSTWVPRDETDSYEDATRQLPEATDGQARRD